MSNEPLTIPHEPKSTLGAAADYHVQDTAGIQWIVGSIGATLFGAIVVGWALVLVGMKRIRPW